MKYVISGKSDSFNNYARNRINVIYAKNEHIFSKIKDGDTIVLLQGWWMRSWAKDALITIMSVYPFIRFEYLDGPFGEKERKNLQSDKISNRFGILDIIEKKPEGK